MTMAYCWVRRYEYLISVNRFFRGTKTFQFPYFVQGMYINGIAVYGRDPVLSCDYAYFLSIDNECPYTKCYLQGLEDMEEHPGNATYFVDKMEPIDWRNCSSSGYIL